MRDKRKMVAEAGFVAIRALYCALRPVPAGIPCRWPVKARSAMFHEGNHRVVRIAQRQRYRVPLRCWRDDPKQTRLALDDTGFQLNFPPLRDRSWDFPV